MRDMTVLRQVAAHLDGWSEVSAEVAADDAPSWPSVLVVGSGGTMLWHCLEDRWTGELHDPDGAIDAPVATIQTTIGEDASASEVADGIKATYRGLRTHSEFGLTITARLVAEGPSTTPGWLARGPGRPIRLR
jgi:hypothetical protein